MPYEYTALLPPVRQDQIDEFGHVSDVEFNIIGRKHALTWFKKYFGSYAKWCAPITKNKVCVYSKPLVLDATNVRVKTHLISWDPDGGGSIVTTVYDNDVTYYSETRDVRVLVHSPALSLRTISRYIGFNQESKL